MTAHNNSLIWKYFPSSMWKVFFYVACFLIVAVNFYLARNWYHDDAYITLKYAMNFLNGDGLVWNIGERVEGYSNFLFLWIVIALGALGLDLVVATKVINIFAYFGLLSLTLGYLYAQSDKTRVLPFTFIICSFLLVGNIDLVRWSLGGLEGVFLSFLVTSGVLFFLKYLKNENNLYLVGSSIFLILGGLTRLDAGLFILITGLFVIRIAYQKKNSVPLLCFSLPGLILLPYFAGKYYYYGDFLPNTFYAKAGAVSFYKLGAGLLYNLMYMICPPFYLSLFIFLAAKQHKAIRENRHLCYLVSLIGAHILYLIYSGADHMPAFRFFIVIQPVIIITLYHLLELESVSWSIKKQKWIFFSACVWLVLQTAYYIKIPIKADAAGFLGKLSGQYINTHFPKGSLIALNTAGSTPYYAPENTYIDMLGLNDHHIARRKVKINYDLEYQWAPGHNKGDGRYVLERKPDYIILGPAAGRSIDEKIWFLSDYEMSNMADFLDNYELKIAKIDISNVVHSAGYEWVESIKDGIYTFKYYQKRKL